VNKRIQHVEGILVGKGVTKVNVHQGWGGKFVLERKNDKGEVDLNFSTVTTDLLFEIQEKQVSVFEAEPDGLGGLKRKADGSSVVAQGVRNLTGGLGNNSYVFKEDGSISGELKGAADGQVSGKMNILDYTDFDQPVSVNLTDREFEFDKVLNSSVVGDHTQQFRLPIQETWVYKLDHHGILITINGAAPDTGVKVSGQGLSMSGIAGPDGVAQVVIPTKYIQTAQVWTLEVGTSTYSYTTGSNGDAVDSSAVGKGLASAVNTAAQGGVTADSSVTFDQKMKIRKANTAPGNEKIIDLAGNDLSTDLQTFKEAIAELIGRNDFSVSRDIIPYTSSLKPTESRWTVTFSAPGPTGFIVPPIAPSTIDSPDIPRVYINSDEQDFETTVGVNGADQTILLNSNASGGKFGLSLEFKDQQDKTITANVEDINFDSKPDDLRLAIQSAIDEQMKQLADNLSSYELELELVQTDDPTKITTAKTNSQILIAKLGTFPVTTEGEFTVNNEKIAVNSWDHLRDILRVIAQAISPSATVEYDSGADKIKINAESEDLQKMFGASGDLSNFLDVFKLKTPAFIAEKAESSDVIDFDGSDQDKPIGSLSGIEAGFFTINGHRIDITYNQTTNQILGLIAEKIGLGATVQYVSDADKIKIDGKGKVLAADMFGQAEDTSNFLTVFKIKGPTIDSTNDQKAESSDVIDFDGFDQHKLI